MDVQVEKDCICAPHPTVLGLQLKFAWFRAQTGKQTTPSAAPLLHGVFVILIGN